MRFRSLRAAQRLTLCRDRTETAGGTIAGPSNLTSANGNGPFNLTRQVPAPASAITYGFKVTETGVSPTTGSSVSSTLTPGARMRVVVRDTHADSDRDGHCDRDGNRNRDEHCNRDGDQYGHRHCD